MSLPQNQTACKTNRETNPSCARTRCCVITGVGRSAIAVIGVQGPMAAESVIRCFRAATDQPLRAGQIRYGSWVGPSLEHGKEPVDTNQPVRENQPGLAAESETVIKGAETIQTSFPDFRAALTEVLN